MKIATKVLGFTRDTNGSVLVEVTVMLPIMIFFVLGSIDFLFAFYEWNAATKAVQVGARIAAVSDPVMTGFNNLSAALVSASLRPGSAMPQFTVTCDGRTATCTCDGTCQVGGVIRFDAAALNTIVYGRGSKACGDATSSYTAGMCDIFNRITPANVRIEYRQPAAPAGLGYVGRPGGPVPTIKVSLQNIPFRFFFLGSLFHNIQIPGLATTRTGEDLYSCSPMVLACEDAP
jgi:TadE-like protein